MNTAELIAQVRQAATLEDESTEFDAPEIVRVMNQTMGSVFEPLIASQRAGYWLHTLTRTLGTGNPYVRLHPRACALEQVDIRQGSNDWQPLTEAIDSELQDWPQRAYPVPQVYVVRGSTVLLQPAPVYSDIQLRAKVIVRPNQLVTEQSAGRVTAVDTTARTVSVSGLPLDMTTNATISGVLVIDIIEPRGNFERSLFDAPAQVLDGSTIQIGAGPSLGRIEIGDYVRVAGQTDWPQLPESFHHVLATATAATICVRRDMEARASTLGDISSSNLQRLIEHMTPRVKATTHKPLQHSWR